MVIPGVYDGRGKMFFFVNFEATHSAEHDHDQLDAAAAGRAERHLQVQRRARRAASTCMRWRRPTDSIATPDPTVAKLLADIRNSTTQRRRRSRRSPAISTPSASRSSSRAGGPVYYPTIRMDYNLTSGSHRLSGTWYRQRFTDTSFDTTNSRQPTWPGFPLYGTQGSFREAYTGTFRSTLTQNIVNEARVAYSGAPVQFGPYHNPSMYTGSLANQGGYALGINAASASPTPGRRSRRARVTRRRSPSRTPSTGSRAHTASASAASSASTTSGSTPTARDAVPSIAFGTQTGDPALAMFTAANFPGSSSARSQHRRRALRRAHRTRDQSSARRRGSMPARASTCTRATAARKAGCGSSTSSSRTTGEREPNLSINLGLRYALQMPFYAHEQQLLDGDARRRVGRLRLRAGLRPEQPDAARPATCSSRA